MEKYLKITDLLSGEIQIDFNRSKQIFILSVPIFRSHIEMSPSVKTYIESRVGYHFKPHSTSFLLHGANQVDLVQEIPFQGNLKDLLGEFWKLAKACHHQLVELAVEETLATATAFARVLAAG